MYDKKTKQPLVVTVRGAQGSGKSSLRQVLVDAGWDCSEELDDPHGAIRFVAYMPKEL